MVNLYRFVADSNERFQVQMSLHYTRDHDLRIKWPSFTQDIANNVSRIDATHTVLTDLTGPEVASEKAVGQNDDKPAPSAMKPVARPPAYMTADGVKH